MDRFYRLATAAIVALGVISGPALASTFTSGSVTLNGIGAQFASPFDNIIVTGGAGTFLDAGQLGVKIASGAFVVGVNCNPCTNEHPSGSFTEAFSVNGSPTQNFVIDWSWSSTGPIDTLMLSIAQGVLDIGGYIATLHISATTLSSGGGTVPFSLTADLVAAPLPAALPLFASALGAMGWLGWRKRRKGAAVGDKKALA